MRSSECSFALCLVAPPSVGLMKLNANAHLNMLIQLSCEVF